MIIINMNKPKKSNQQAKPLDISMDNIGLPSHSSKNTAPLIAHEHRFIRKQNQALKKQLQSISLRLDQQLKKRSESSKKRPWSNADDVTYLELQNAYKKCQIYKKQANFYRKRLSSFQDESKYEEYDSKMNEYMKENIELKNEIKTLRKAIKLQEKGLQEMGTQEYAKISRQNEQLKEQNRRLKKYLSQYRLASLKSRQSEQHPNDKNATSENEANSDDPNSMKERLEKSYQKNKILTNQNSHLRDMIENYKLQIQEKDRQMNLLKERIANLRKNNELLSQRNLRPKKTGHVTDDYEQGKSETKAKSKAKAMRTQPVQSRVVTYPIKIEKGKGSLSSIRWSDESFAGRIKEIHVVISKNGQIKDIHARYEKGQGKKYSQSKGKTQVFICSEDEYIYSMSGGFVNNCLQFLTLKTNNKRGQSFGTAIEQSNGQIFTFQAKQGQFLGALFGQKSDVGLTKLGCYIMKN